MFLPIVLATVYLASSTVLAAYDKPYYDVEDAENLFKDFVKEHKKVYDRREYSERLEIFKETLKDTNERNAMFPDTVFAVDRFADMKPHELQPYNNVNLSNKNISKLEILDGPDSSPHEFDWRKHNVITPVKNQGSCYGAGSIFAAVGQIEAHYAIKHRQCLAFSEGQVLDCVDWLKCHIRSWAADIIEAIGKSILLEKEEDYPYNPDKHVCHADSSKGLIDIEIIQHLQISNEEMLKKYLLDIGPFAITINDKDLYGYRGGILEPTKCLKEVNHGMLLVGFGEEKGKKFWILKNSWGKDWGEKGYVRLLRGVNAYEIGNTNLTIANIP